MLRFLALIGLQNLFASASDVDDDEVVVEDEVKPGEFPGFPGGKLPTVDELKQMLDSMSGLSDEDKESLRQDLLKKASGASGFGEEATTRQLANSNFAFEFFMLIGLLTVIAFIFVFFGYKLYKSLSERERKREEKKKNKQMKKRK